ncbi:hemolysin family protein [Haladaptatus sp. CMAA 1911]|uniref:hemolysin family protein n=1 Tax=unclassified Haladaptatus TaxID=2622732 RepID=UPI0037544E34
MVDLISVGGLLLAFLLVFMNGVFVAAEFAFVRIRPTQVETLVEQGRPGATIVREAVDELDDYLAVCQLGITLSSLGLGWIGEPAVANLIEPLIGGFVPERTLHLVAFALGFGFITFLHVVFGELAPKTFAIQEAARISLAVALPMKFFYYAFVPGIIVFNGTANYFTRLVGVPPASESEEVHTEEEIRTILTRSEETGQIDIDEVEMIESVFELGDTTAREIMVPRPDVETVPGSMPFPDLQSVAAKGVYTRYLVLDETGEHPLGFVHAKDILRSLELETDDADSLVARDLARDVLVVPETGRIDDILAELQTRGGQMAAVIDEWGVFEGIITIEDILEEIVGDIRDEFDIPAQERSIEKQNDGTYVVDGGASLQDVNDMLDTAFESDDVDTIGGWVLSYLGRVPETSDQIEQDEYVLRVDEIEDTRISRLVIQQERSSQDTNS